MIELFLVANLPSLVNFLRTRGYEPLCTTVPTLRGPTHTAFVKGRLRKRTREMRLYRNRPRSHLGRAVGREVNRGYNLYALHLCQSVHPVRVSICTPCTSVGRITAHPLLVSLLSNPESAGKRESSPGIPAGCWGRCPLPPPGCDPPWGSVLGGWMRVPQARFLRGLSKFCRE